MVRREQNLTLEESLLSGYLWTARLSNPAQVTDPPTAGNDGGAPTMVGATAQIIGNVLAKQSLISCCAAQATRIRPPSYDSLQVLVAVLLLSLPADTCHAYCSPARRSRSPARCCRTRSPACGCHSPPQPVVVLPAQPAVLAPATTTSRPWNWSTSISIRWAIAERCLSLRRDGGEIEFLPESKARDGYEWHAAHDDDKLYVPIDNDYNDKVYLHGHKNKRSMRCTEIEITGRDRCKDESFWNMSVRRGKAER